MLTDVHANIDVLTKRAGWEESVRVLHLVRNSPEVEGWASALTVPLLYFFRLRSARERQARTDAQASVHGFRLAPLSAESWNAGRCQMVVVDDGSFIPA